MRTQSWDHVALLPFLERLTCLNRLEPGMRMSVGPSLWLPLWGRTFLLLLSVAMAQSHWPSEPSEAARDWENQLEASMHSALSDLHEAVPTVVGIPDGTAVVGRSFRVTIPTDLIASNGEVIKVRLARTVIRKNSVTEEEFSACSLVLILVLVSGYFS